jgi:sulfopyruvate decarboxylase subunit alpha
MTHWSAGVCDGVYAAGVRDVVYVPDNPLSHVLARFERSFRDVSLILAMREEEAFGIAAGLYLGGRRPAVMLQSSGLGNSINALATLVVPYRIPMLIVVSMRGDEGEWNSAQVPMGRAVPGILAAIGVVSDTIDACQTVSDGVRHQQIVSDTVRGTALSSFETKIPRACLLPKRLTAP